ncbi:Glycosyltransferase, family GT4 [Ectocarpus siliculosus]|uniref:Glycosyltransferase, family GT4 n=1 Tax=Ectocarpus siliculosus TaxID=2880 RepID=D7FK38_ECTSI|nr:Glycosyltransferase, family GT4 [Ectocarpus siliculosus]|eukprot:CBJ29248.1 Glycosyltransferase, family GT4 [Ectocarpus siliculosus]
MPPTQSSRWQVFNDELSSFEGTGKIVSISCPACTALAISTLPDAFAACDGPYRVRAVNSENGVVAWVHVSDERCTMLHDHAGSSLLAIDGSIEVGKASSFGGAAVSDPLYKEWWTEITRNVSTLQYLGVDAGVVCTAASQTTRLVFDLTKTGQTTTPCNDTNNADTKAEATACTSARFKLSSQQNGSIISSTSSTVHLQIDDAAGLMQSGAMSTGVADLGLAETAADDGGPARALLIKVVVDGVEATKISLKEASTKGVLLSFDDLQGTHAFEISMLETQAGSEVCLAETAMILEIFTAEPHIVTGRPSIRRKLSPSSSGIVTREGGPQVTRVVFLGDLEVLDGYKLSTLHLMKNLPTNFRASTLDLSCASGDLPVKDLFDKEGIEVFHLCIEIPNEVWNSVQAQGVTIFAFLYSALVGAPTWNDVVSVHPGVALALSDLYHHLVKFDVLVMSNGGKDTDAYVLQIARLAGVRTRMVNLGAIAGGYMSPLFSGATTLVGPSHYVAHNPTVIRNAGGLPIKVCHPVMDAARVLEAARSCHATRVQMPDQPETRPGTGEGGADDALAGALPPARFIMVGQVSSEKTPGVFVRSIAVLQRRWVAGGRQGMRQVEGVMVGKGPILRQMEKLALDLRTGVRFTGALSIDKVPCEVQLATALVLPSMCPETFGMVGPEAMLLGVPLVTFGFGGSGELVRHMENGLLVAEPTPRALADALELLARDTALRDRLGAAARLDALRALSIPEMVACHVNEF